MRIGKIRGSDPETFLVITPADDPKAMFTSYFLTEEQLREIMTRGGASIIQTDGLIAQARKHEVQ
jgi:hypothetical protein